LARDPAALVVVGADEVAILPPADFSSAASARVSTMITGMPAWLALTITETIRGSRWVR